MELVHGVELVNIYDRGSHTLNTACVCGDRTKPLKRICSKAECCTGLY